MIRTKVTDTADLVLNCSDVVFWWRQHLLNSPNNKAIDRVNHDTTFPLRRFFRGGWSKRYRVYSNAVYLVIGLLKVELNLKRLYPKTLIFIFYRFAAIHVKGVRNRFSECCQARTQYTESRSSESKRHTAQCIKERIKRRQNKPG